MKILVINGPNLNLLGRRETGIYGKNTLNDLNEKLSSFAKQYNKNVELDFYQSNSEGEIVDRIQADFEQYEGILINPAAYTHTSVAIRDALLSVDLPVVEVHISNIFKREHFRRKSYISDVSAGVISGFGINSYFLGIKGLIDHILQTGK